MKNYNYKTLAKYYDLIELEEYTPKYQNELLSKFFKEKGVKTILDITCGTGAQTIYLKQQGFEITGNDISTYMLDIAKEKAKQQNLTIPFLNLDMRKDTIGKYDAVISQCNSIGHLNKKDFNKALANIYNNLNNKGYFIFDIYNFNKYCKGTMTKKFIDTCIKKEDYKIVRIAKNKFNCKKQLLKLRQHIYIQEKRELHVFKNNWNMQIYNASQLNTLLQKNGFKIVNLYNRHGGEFDDKESWFILTIAQKNPHKNEG